ncbi:MAG: 3-isopropylmalate dehydrogenase [candidate division Zixibacteria bacterium]|nr:3-isopropylmalate dehydrogenase [candidate division Zixibacteria bacterium]MDH3938181.1 3-isopropylmalate dehydrogenase [candidate division Zixibacteria bacterium]
MHKIAVLGGDGIGPEVTTEALKVLQVASELTGFKYETTEYPFGSEHYLKTGELVPDSVYDEYRQHDAIYLGAIGDPRCEVGLVERAVIAGIRFKLDLYINLRPIKLYSEALCPIKNKKCEDVDMVVVRENTEDVYTGLGGIMKAGTPDEVAIANMVFTRKGCERAVRYAFELAKARNKDNKVTLVDKANAIRAQDIWTRTMEEVGSEYPDIEKDHAYIDAACMWLVKNPEWFDVVVTTNIFGDIFTDLGAMVQGGMGIAASGNIHPGQVSMFEPIHGSAPKYKDKNVACPIAAIMAGQMMLDFLGEKEGAAVIENAVTSLLKSGKLPSLDARSGFSTSQVGDMVVDELKKSNTRTTSV